MTSNRTDRWEQNEREIEVEKGEQVDRDLDELME